MDRITHFRREFAMQNPQLELAHGQIRAARSYTNWMLEGLNEDEWFAMPGGATHIAWQVGHLAMAQYRLCLDRIRGERPDDESLISAELLRLWGRDSVPDADRTKYPPVAELRGVFDRVYEAALRETATLTAGDLAAAPLKPHHLFETKLGALLWCSRHEMVHAGQIGLLRRLLGRKPQW